MLSHVIGILPYTAYTPPLRMHVVTYSDTQISLSAVPSSVDA